MTYVLGNFGVGETYKVPLEATESLWYGFFSFLLFERKEKLNCKQDSSSTS